MSNFLSAKTYSHREQKRIIKNNGYELIRQTGSHWIYRNSTGRILSNCYTKDSNKGVFQKLIKQYNLNVDL